MLYLVPTYSAFETFRGKKAENRTWYEKFFAHKLISFFGLGLCGGEEIAVLGRFLFLLTFLGLVVMVVFATSFIYFDGYSEAIESEVCSS